MKKTGILVVLLILLIVLLGAMIFRYEQLEKHDGIDRYIDRWTGKEWIKVTNAAGEDRLLAKYYQYSGTMTVPEKEMVAELVQIANTEHILIIVWWVLLFTCLGGAAMTQAKRGAFRTGV